MTILAGDIRLARSLRMVDRPEGGGPPSAQLMTTGRSNEIFPDISEETRTVGRVEIYQIHGVLRNTDKTPFTGTNVIVSKPPDDPRVSCAILTLKNPFATRADIAKRMESGMNAASEFSGYLLENHWATMPAIQILQRPEGTPPAIGRTYVLVYNEGVAGERRQRIKIKATSSLIRKYTDTSGSKAEDFDALVTTCELFDSLTFDFPGSPPVRTFTRGATKTLLRETMYTDAGLFYSASKLTKATTLLDNWIETESVYVQVVPNSKGEVSTTDQRPTAKQTLLLASSPRQVEAATTLHTRRIKIAEENAGTVFLADLKPLPQPGSVFIDYWALGQLYRIYDDGAVQLKGSGSGTVNYLTGTLLIGLKAVPDIGSTICITFASPLSFTNRSAQGPQVRAPEYSWIVEGDSDLDRIVPSTLIIGYTSGGTVYTVIDNGTGKLTGDGSGVVDYPSRSVLLRPAHMPDAGAQLQIDCELEALVTEIIAAPGSPDAAGIIHFQTAQVPAAGTFQLTYVVSRAVSSSSGAQLTTTTASKTTDITYTSRSVPEYYEPAAGTGVPYVNWPRSTAG
ncbi:hypothetical protein G7047_19230 [Diaphorobacter sp. HDW4A]|uniref:hypothetical protein n=1 Tax=Diaphorobacter sp. HDW4A TaxID=2714924 RepID=UPI001409A45A|nr:hypothetical protein [Diaphorobacter sp. HDW4A]QIL81811.1 hypothetical protein G7047_19230 [Diaphorobacter sp. HDW4A]